LGGAAGGGGERGASTLFEGLQCIKADGGTQDPGRLRASREDQAQVQGLEQFHGEEACGEGRL
jgi:hypothetical protein